MIKKKKKIEKVNVFKAEREEMSINLFLVCDTCKVYKVMNNGPYPRIEKDKNSHLLKREAIEDFLEWVEQMNEYFDEYSRGINLEKISELADFLEKHKKHKVWFSNDYALDASWDYTKGCYLGMEDYQKIK